MARIDHIERLLRRGASVGAVLDEMPEATRKDADAARKRVGKHGSLAYMVRAASHR